MNLLDAPGKIARIREVAAEHPEFGTFVETGTASGDLDLGVADIFGRIVTIEADNDLYRNASARLLHLPHVRVLHGDSGWWLGLVLDGVAEPCIIWLDAHEIADDGDSALELEMLHIAHAMHRHIVLIDDARLCRGRKGWPSLEEIAAWADSHHYVHGGITDDIITLMP